MGQLDGVGTEPRRQHGHPGPAPGDGSESRRARPLLRPPRNRREDRPRSGPSRRARGAAVHGRQAGIGLRAAAGADSRAGARSGRGRDARPRAGRARVLLRLAEPGRSAALLSLASGSDGFGRARALTAVQGPGPWDPAPHALHQRHLLSATAAWVLVAAVHPRTASDLDLAAALIVGAAVMLAFFHGHVVPPVHRVSRPSSRAYPARPRPSVRQATRSPTWSRAGYRGVNSIRRSSR